MKLNESQVEDSLLLNASTYHGTTNQDQASPYLRRSPVMIDRTLMNSPNVLNSTLVNSDIKQTELKDVSIFNMSSKNRPDSGQLKFSIKKQALFERPKPGKLMINSPVSDFGNTTINDRDETQTGTATMMHYNKFFSETPISPKEASLVKKEKVR